MTNDAAHVDVKMISEQTGEIDFFTDPAGAKARVAQLRNLFMLSRTTLDPIISEYTDRTQYRAGSVGDEQFLKVQEKIDKTRYVDEGTNHLFIRVDSDENNIERISQKFLEKQS